MWKRDKLAACALIVLAMFVVSNALADEPMRTVVDANSICINAGAAQVAQYRYGDVPFKPYIKELFTPSGLNVLLDAPHDHLHHHALMFAVAVDGVNFWEETPTAGRQKHLRFTDVFVADDGGKSRVGFQEELDWIAPSGEKLLAEERVICISQMKSQQATILTLGQQTRGSSREGVRYALRLALLRVGDAVHSQDGCGGPVHQCRRKAGRRLPRQRTARTFELVCVYRRRRWQGSDRRHVRPSG